ncbi:MAG: hypothetical protein OXC83_05315 [Chloroflexi bacterium]|nr:hypothetical protein [Chloroflexota bacterium]
MENRLIALDLVLKELGLPANIDTLPDRILLQKAIYLAQEAGVNLGYRFSWYVRGPYSTGLTRDYYDLKIASAYDDEEPHGKFLHDAIKSRIARMAPILQVPTGVELSQSHWLELVSSLHYLRKRVTKASSDDAQTKLHELKPDIADFSAVAVTELDRIEL